MAKSDNRDGLRNDNGYYSLVVEVAKKAREIAEDAEEQNIILDKKPVKLAIEALLEEQQPKPEFDDEDEEYEDDEAEEAEETV